MALSQVTRSNWIFQVPFCRNKKCLVLVDLLDDGRYPGHTRKEMKEGFHPQWLQFFHGAFEASKMASFSPRNIFKLLPLVVATQGGLLF